MLSIGAETSSVDVTSSEIVVSQWCRTVTHSLDEELIVSVEEFQVLDHDIVVCRDDAKDARSKGEESRCSLHSA